MLNEIRQNMGGFYVSFGPLWLRSSETHWIADLTRSKTLEVKHSKTYKQTFWEAARKIESLISGMITAL